MVVAVVNFAPGTQPGLLFTIFGTIFMLLLAYLMVSKVEFFSLKQVNVAKLHPLAFVVLGALIALIWYNHQIGLLVLASMYVLSGPLKIFMKKKLPVVVAGTGT